jgi:predicted PurR-regulated permease PerM
MISSLLLSASHTIITFFIVLGLIAFRLAWGHPAFRVIIGYFPKSWQRWLFDESSQKAD